MIAGLGDLIGAVLFPFGAYFPGFTISNVLSGLIYGIFLQNMNSDDWKSIMKLIVSSMLVLGMVNVLVNSLWLHILYQKAYVVVLSARILAQVIMLPIQVIIIYCLEKWTRPFVKKYLWED